MADDKYYAGFYIGHLHIGERNRIQAGQLNPHEREMLNKGEDPWAKFRGPQKETKGQGGAEEWYSDDPNDVSLLTGRRKKFTALRIPADKGTRKKQKQEELPLSTGMRVPGQSRSENEDERRQREQEKIETEVVEFMHRTYRDKYNDPNTPEDQRKAIFEKYKEKLEERKRREAAEFQKKLDRIAEAQDLLQRIEADPTKAEVPRPADDSEEAMLKWLDDMSKPRYTFPPFPSGLPESEARKDRMWRAVQAGRQPDPEDIAEEESEALRYKLRLQQAREQRRPEVEKEFLSPRDIPLAVDENLRAPQDISLQLKDDLHAMGDVATSPAPNDKPWHKRGDLVLAVVLALGAAVLAIAVILLPPTSVKAVIFWLTILFFLLAAAEILVARYREWSWFKTIVGIVLMLLVVVVFGWFAWPEPKPQASVEKPLTEVKAIPPPESITNTTPQSNSNVRPKRILYTIQGQDADLKGAEVSAYNEHSEYTFKGYIENEGEIRIEDLPGGFYVIIVSHPKFGRFHGRAIVPLEDTGKALPILDADAMVRLERWLP